MNAPTPILGWDAPRQAWLRERAKGAGASDVAAALGFSRWQTPWEVWVAKTGRLLRPDAPSPAAQLGTDLEPWLLGRAPALLEQQVDRTPHQLYAHPEVPWQRCSPDAFAQDGGLVEAKTAGLIAWERPEDWHDGGIPLGYELQGRWQMMVMDRPRVHMVALVAGLGVVVRRIERDLVVEAELCRQMTEWWNKHVVGGQEPPIGRNDLDTLAALYTDPNRAAAVELDAEALEWRAKYLEAVAMESFYRKTKEETGALFKAALGNACIGQHGDETLVTWNPKQNEVDWEQMARDLAAKADLPLPDPDTYRRPPGRTLSVKKRKIEVNPHG
jgi:putative phage-type endonuclease